VIDIALARLAAGSEAVAIRNPSLQVAGASRVLETLVIASFAPGELRRRVANPGGNAQAVWDALDCALHGY
jgi:hypothetical protein